VTIVRRLLEAEPSAALLPSADAFLARWWSAISKAAERRTATRIANP
jgi:hypothetical protein